MYAGATHKQHSEALTFTCLHIHVPHGSDKQLIAAFTRFEINPQHYRQFYTPSSSRHQFYLSLSFYQRGQAWSPLDSFFFSHNNKQTPPPPPPRLGPNPIGRQRHQSILRCRTTSWRGDWWSIAPPARHIYPHRLFDSPQEKCINSVNNTRLLTVANDTASV